MIAVVMVALGFRMPQPVIKGYVRVVVAADTETEAELIACQMAAAECDMPMASEIVELLAI